eukprot:NODE_6011_length_615_cov_194.351590_g5608_i0.p1 GENE.NODE_6011_length_615_cov_194.351590_g5608_i0~~NODE_6011_length_615_cov_194.351590_g5608_i0.p1  ORF type:complete len:164 (-),score=29.79 NODE_6011_length_615_cov_194.351590_g5608_i0:52-543(-)
MADVVDDLHQTSFQSQKRLFHATKRPIKKFTNKNGVVRFWKKVGLGFKTPKEAINGTYIDKKCPFTGNVSIRGRILRGIIISNKMKRTCVIRRNYLHWIKKYQRFEKRHKNFSVHLSPCFTPAIGDEAIFGQCRPLSKTVRFNVLQVNPKSMKKTTLKKFGKF